MDDNDIEYENNFDVLFIIKKYYLYNFVFFQIKCVLILHFHMLGVVIV